LLNLCHVEPSAAGFTSERGLRVKRYEAADAAQWDAFVRSGKNATFLFERGYMDYHSDRFTDHSLMVFQGQRLLALLPANLNADGHLQSHGGLTYGGFVFAGDERLAAVLDVFRATLEYMRAVGIGKLHYRRIPRFYNPVPDDEVDYALFLSKATLVRRDCALVVPMQHRLPFSKRRRREINRARTAGVQVIEDSSFERFWQKILVPRLQQRYGVSPVHSTEEITLLAQRFPQHIRQFCAVSGGEILAGITIYETPTVAHVQYSAMSEAGQDAGALDAIVDHLIGERYADKSYFDFGISNEKAGLVLNHGLLDWKEGFGARSAAHDFYVIDADAYPLLDSALGPL
jgi:hypothetical protein